jgi:fatty acid desaturase
MGYTRFTAEESAAIQNKPTILWLVSRPGGLVGFYFLIAPWPSAHWSVTAFWTLFTAYFLFSWTSCFHETAHQTLTRFRSVSVWFGRFLGAMMFVPYTAYRETHIRHHAYLNTPRDWELWPYASPDCSLTFRRFFAWLDLAAGILTGPYIYSRIYFHKNSPLVNPAIRRTIRNELLLVIGLWGSILLVIDYWNAWSLFLRIWLVPAILAGFLQTGRKLTEHLGMSSFDPLLGTRTVMGTNWVTRLCTFLNFDIFIHGPHHRHPRLTRDQLGSKMDDYMTENPETAYPVYPSYWQAVRAMLPSLFVNPGCGVNAGAALTSRRETEVEVDDFVADVTEEILAT